MLKKLSLDSYRLLAALLVVAIHIYPLTSISENIDFMFSRVFCRIAVPFFLMITGYFVLPKSLENKNVLKEYTFKILKIYGISILLFLPLNIYNHYFTGIIFFILLKDILWNGTFYHLWYFPALILGIWLTYFILKMKKKTLQILILCVLYSIGLLGDSYYGLTQNIPVLNTIYGYLFQIFDYTRNGIFYVPMFLSIGFFIGKEKKQKNGSLSLSLLFLVLMLVEGSLLHRFDLQRHSSMYLFLVPTAYCLFHWMIKNTSGANKKLRNLATWLYILHPWFIVIIRLIAKIIHLENLLVENSILNYLAVVIATICFLLVLDKIKTRLKRT